MDIFYNGYRYGNECYDFELMKYIYRIWYK